MRYRTTQIINIVITIIFFPITSIIVSSQKEGDIVLYRQSFEQMPSLDIVNGYIFYQHTVGSGDPFSFLTQFLLSRVFSYQIYSALTSALLFYLTKKIFDLYKKTLWNFFLSLPLNFYFLVIAFSLERLKICLIFILMALLANSTRIKHLLSVASILSHSQSVLFFAKNIASAITNSSGKRSYVSLLMFLSLIAAALFYNHEAILQKFEYYHSNLELTPLSYAGITIFGSVLLFNASNKYVAIIEILIYAVTVTVIGPDRVNLVIYISMMWQVYLQKKHPPAIIYLPMLYFNIKGAIYLYAIINGESGF
ncbi:hypothetical protein QU487_16070 [Crenobacter sp. SG2305]|uniref:hypothetical protein n=1 Tax=Crenobacter oryzisoli TaxID=3056844 RepID=UPI0025AA625A|nr:hypothetical protein [Crenobacter sp. SG2305]MDN0084257.1 hypothetical protein [Crenobacter sp. SG2305]